MAGFFTRNEVSSNESLGRMTGCAACGLYKNCSNPKVGAFGRGEKGILIVAEIPGEGEATDLLRSKLRAQGIDLDRDCRKVYSVSCRTPKGRTPTANEITQCRPRVWREISEFQPKLVLLLGGVAVESFLGGRWTKDMGGITKWRGWTIPDRDAKAWVCPTFHPSYVVKSLDSDSMKMYQPVVDVIFDQDIHRAIKCLDEELPRYIDEPSQIKVIHDQRELGQLLNGIYEFEDPISWDVEATGLKLHAPGHRIVSMSISVGECNTWSFLMPPEGSRNRHMLKTIMASQRIRKMAHNMKYEDNAWNVRGVGVVNNWFWDSMLATHCLDNRPGICSLKFQSYVHFGLLPYDEHIEPFLRSSEEDVSKYGGNAFNRINEIPVNELLVYGGIDSLVEHRLALLQMKQMRVSP